MRIHPSKLRRMYPHSQLELPFYQKGVNTEGCIRSPSKEVSNQTKKGNHKEYPTGKPYNKKLLLFTLSYQEGASICYLPIGTGYKPVQNSF